MRKPEKPALIRWLYRSEFSKAVSFRVVLKQAAQGALQKDPISAEAYAESNAQRVWSNLLQEQEEDERRGISRVFEVLDTSAMTLRWCAPQSLLPEMTARAARLRQRPALLKMIDELTDREFEALACVAMRFAGATETTLTPKGNEGGVDFFALIPFHSSCHLFSGGTHPVRVVGQSKKYTSSVQAGKFKEFLKTMDEVKHGGEPKTEAVIPAWFRSKRGPLVGLMIAHSGFQSGAETRARRHGVLTADSLDLAETIALSTTLPLYLTADERVAECRSRIAQLLS